MEYTVQEAKTQLSALLRQVEDGAEVYIRRGHSRVAQLIPAQPVREKRAIWGNVPGAIGDDFDDEIADFESYMPR